MADLENVSTQPNPKSFDQNNLIEFCVNSSPGKLLIDDGNGNKDVFKFYYESFLETESFFCINLFYKYTTGSVLNDNSEKFIKIFNNNDNIFKKSFSSVRDKDDGNLHYTRYCDILIERTYEKHFGSSFHFHDSKKKMVEIFF